MDRMTRTLALLLVLAGCERIDEPQAQPEPVAKAPKPALPPAVAVPAPDMFGQPPKPSLVTIGQPEITYHQPAGRHRAPMPEVSNDNGLPQPPSQEPAAYNRWYAALAPRVRAKLDAFCRKDGLTEHDECGGIGPYHIPQPPSLAMAGGQEDYDRWLARLTPRQHRYYVESCEQGGGGESTMFSDLCGGTPLVVQLDPTTPIAFTARGIPGVDAAQTPWLVLDRNGDGAITIDELFGDATPLADGTRASNGFAALAQYDANGDGVIDARDPVFARLALWNGTTLEPLAARVASIELANHREPRCNPFGCEGERSVLRTAAGTLGAVVDVYLRR
jgi:hypothetical protein